MFDSSNRGLEWKLIPIRLCSLHSEQTENMAVNAERVSEKLRYKLKLGN